MKNKVSKRKRKFRGMTLIEIIIALAIFAIMGFMLVLAATTIEQHSRAAKELNDKVAVQGPIAEAQNKSGSVLLDDSVEIKVNSNIIVKGALYDTADYVVDADGNYVRATDGAYYEDLNLKYIADISVPTTSP